MISQNVRENEEEENLLIDNVVHGNAVLNHT